MSVRHLIYPVLSENVDSIVLNSVLCVISYLLLYVRSLNHPEKNRVTELMQALF
ncbi:hypothetical protein RDWZM_004914, partial [Blomia tropicalis]